ncbi:MAG: SDR family NAD(P)-dependent oxidoreductase [Gemmatimonadales bacterium]
MTAGGPVLVTGATGFLGAHLVHRLVGEGREVHSYGRAGSDGARLADVADKHTRWVGDVNDAASLSHALTSSRAEVVLHCAGDTSTRKFDGDWDAIDRAMHVNLFGTLTLLRAAGEPGSQVRQVIRLGGLEEYGTAPTPWSEEMREEPSSPYSASQVAATHACQALQPHLPFSVMTLRPALVYGPGQSRDFLIPALVTTLLRGRRFPMTGGQQHRDLIHVDDLIDAVLAAMRHPEVRGAVINISAAQEWKIVDVARQIARLVDAEALLDIGALAQRPGDLTHLVARNDLAAELLGWYPRVTLEAGLQQTVEWYKANTSPSAQS